MTYEDETGVSNPFPGLRSFEPDEDYLFFGREERVDELLTRLRKTRFLTVVGASGSGKSSLVRSGLIPSLFSGFMAGAGSDWRIVILRPGDNPIGNLAACVNDEELFDLEEEMRSTNQALLEATLRRSEMGLVEAVRTSRLDQHENLLVLVDQFEELFRFKSSVDMAGSRAEAVSFVKLLLSAASQAELPIYVVLTMRSDFIGQCTELEGLVEAINTGQYLVPRMTREERRQAIVGPVAVGGGEITPRLVTRILNDVGDDPDQLPIMQHAMMRTWDYWSAHRTDGEPIDMRHYEAIGTLQRALSEHAEEAFAELGEGQTHDLCETIFRSLTDRRGVRHPRRLEELCALTGSDAATVVSIIDRFRAPGRSFLMPPAGAPLVGTSVVDISHESLMRVWTRLASWVEEENQSAQIYLRLCRAAELHQEGKGGLWRDPELQLALNWYRENRPTPLWAERYDPNFERAAGFLEASDRARAQELAQKEALQRRRLQRARWFAILVGALGLMAAIVAVIAIQKTAEAQQERQLAIIARNDAEQQRSLAERQRQLATEQGEEAERRRVMAEEALDSAERSRLEAERQREQANEQRALARQSEREALEQRSRAEQAMLEAEAQRQSAIEQREVAVAARDQAQEAENITERLRRLAIAHRLALDSQRLSADAEPAVPALLARAAYQINLDNGGPLVHPAIDSALRASVSSLREETETTLTGWSGQVRSVRFSPDGRLLAAGGEDAEIGIFRRTDLGLVQELETGGRFVRRIAFEPDGRTVAAGLDDGSLVLWDLESKATTSVPLEGGPVQDLALDPAGERWASLGTDGIVRLVRTTDPTAPPEAIDAQPPIRAITWMAEGRLLLARSDGTIADRDGRSPSPAGPIPPMEGVRTISASSDGRWLAAGTADGQIRVWRLDRADSEGTALLGHESAVTSLEFDPGGDTLASTSFDHTVRLWTLAGSRPEARILAGHRSWVWSASFSPDGRSVASAGADRSLRVWTVATAELADEVCRRVEGNLSPAAWTELVPDLPYEKACPNLPTPETTIGPT